MFLLKLLSFDGGHIVKTHSRNKNEEWKLRLFLSVDLIGSSSYKANKNENEKDDYEWCVAFEDFYHDFPRELKNQYDNSPEYLKNIESNEPQIWKILGDEILLYTDITDYKQVPVHLIALKNTLIKYNNKLYQKKVPIIRGKGTAWIAGFPVNNIEINIKFQSNSHIDFIGPSIDAGFRLTKHSTIRKLVMSIDTLLLFSQAMIDVGSDRTSKSNPPITDKHDIRFDGQFELKGVYNSTPYPVFWLDVKDHDWNIFSNEDKWLGRGNKCDYIQIVGYCSNYLSAKNSYMIIPFIANGTSKRFEEVPDYMEKRRKKISISRESYMDTKNSSDSGDERNTEKSKIESKEIQGIILSKELKEENKNF